MTDTKALLREAATALRDYERDSLAAKLEDAAEAAVPVWLDPYTNNGDRRPDTEYRQGWNACRDAMLATTEDAK